MRFDNFSNCNEISLICLQAIKVEVLSLFLAGYCSPYGCVCYDYYDTLSFYNGHAGQSRLSIQYCDSAEAYTNGTAPIELFLDTVATIHFSSDRSVTEAGFLLNITSVDVIGMYT